MALPGTQLWLTTGGYQNSYADTDIPQFGFEARHMCKIAPPDASTIYNQRGSCPIHYKTDMQTKINMKVFAICNQQAHNTPCDFMKH